MKQLFYILLFILSFSSFAQKDSIQYFKLDTIFHSNWIKTTKKDAEFYRKFPLKKVGNLYQVKDYYINGNLQMEGFWIDPISQIHQGKTTWYYKNGNKKRIETVDHGDYQGECKTFFKDGTIKTNGIYKKDLKYSGSFEECCPHIYYTTYKNGEKETEYQYYKNSKIIATKSFYGKEGYIIKTVYFDNKGIELGKIKQKQYNQYIDGTRVWFNTDNDRNIIGIISIAEIKNEVLNGKSIDYNEQGELMAQGTYKNGKPLDSTFYGSFYDDIFRIKTYKNGVLDGKVTVLTKSNKIAAVGIYKNGERWSGRFYDNYVSYHQLTNYIDGKMTGEQIGYFDENFTKLATKYYTINESKEGKMICYNRKGKRISKGIFKNDKYYNGTFYNFLYSEFLSYKNGIKHGLYINFKDNYGSEIVLKQEYDEGKLTGKITSEGYFKNKDCDCIYKKGKPYKGNVCSDNFIRTYKKSFVVKSIEYDIKDLEKLISINEYKNDNLIKETNFIDGKTYQLTYKNNKRYNGTEINLYDHSFRTYKNGLLNGLFDIPLGYSSIWISGNNVNNKYQGEIIFKDLNTNKKTFCIYNNGKPIDGTILTEDNIITYKNGLKEGKTYGNKPFYHIINGQKELIYNYSVKSYKNDKLNGNAFFYKNDSLINKNYYLDGVKYNGLFYVDNIFKNQYKEGKFIQSNYKIGKYNFKENYKNYLIDNITASVNNKSFYTGKFKYGEEFSGKFIEFNDKENPSEYTLKTYNEGEKQGKETLILLKENKEIIINTKNYEKGILLKETWLNFDSNKDKTITGTYKNNKPYSGDFLYFKEKLGFLYHYKNGKKQDYQYSGLNENSLFKKTDSILYKNHKPYEGTELDYFKDLILINHYKNGIKTISEIEDKYGYLVGTTTFSNKGCVTTNINSDKIVNEYIIEDKNNAKVILYKDFKKAGYVLLKNGNLKKIKIVLKEGGFQVTYTLNEENKLKIIAQEEKIKIIIYPEFKDGKIFTYLDFLNTEKLFLKNISSKGYFYLKDDKNPISVCSIKNGREYNGTVIGYSNNSKTYYYKKYKKGKRVKKVRNLTKKQLLKIVNND